MDILTDKNKRGFLYGLATGVGSMIVIIVVFAAGASFGGGNVFEKNNDAAGTVPTAQAPTQQQPQGPEGDVTKIAKVGSGDHIRGDAKAKVTMIEYSDFECPFCSRFNPTLKQVLSEYPGQVRLIYRHFPLRSIHPNAQKAAEATECAADQGKFWEMHDKLFELTGAGTPLAVPTLKAAAQELGLNTATFDTCLDSNEKADEVDADYRDGLAGGVSGTPGTFVNDQYLAGALSYPEVKAVIDSLLQ